MEIGHAAIMKCGYKRNSIYVIFVMHLREIDHRGD
jgi:hypothetical protein